LNRIFPHLGAGRGRPDRFNDEGLFPNEAQEALRDEIHDTEVVFPVQDAVD